MVDELRILNTSETPPFPLDEDVEVSDNLRLQYRYTNADLEGTVDDGGDLLLEMFWEGDSDVTVRTCGWNTQHYRENYTHVKGREIEPPKMLCLHLKLTFVN